MDKIVLDASAVIACIDNEPGGTLVLDEGADLLLSSVNFAEAVAVLTRRGDTLERIRTSLSLLDFEIVDFDRALAEATGALIAQTQSKGLSLGDRACLALAVRESAPVLTADRAWRDLDVGVEIRFIR